MVDNNFAVLIRKRWRGYKTRSRVYAELSEDPTKTPETSMMRKRLMPPPRTPLRGNSEHISAKQEVAKILPAEGTLTNTEKIPFDQNYDVVILIDGMSGLPLITTATRIQTTLYMPTKQQITDSYFSSISDLQSEFTNPHYSIRIRWRGKMLHPTMTIVCKIDTLEAPHLEPRCIGYTAIRLCVDALGMQPLSEVLYDGRPSCFFNTGQFMVPILYGIPSNDLEFMTEAKLQENLPHIDGAFVRLGILALKPNEPVPDQPFSSMKIDSFRRPGMLNLALSPDDKALSNMIDPLSPTSKSVASMVLKTYLAASGELAQRIIANEDIMQQFQRGDNLELMEKQNLISAIYDFVQKSFLEGKDPKDCVNARYLLEYSDAYGAMASLDMLYNMPDRKKLIQAAEKAGAVAAMRNGLTKAWDNKINCFKTVFRYLPGALPTVASESKNDPSFILSNPVSPHAAPQAQQATYNNGGNNNGNDTVSSFSPHSQGKIMSPKSIRHKFDSDSMEAMAVKQDMANNSLIVDDASVKLAFDSTERCPEYLDDFSSTAGMKLGPHACLLIVVTAVDVLTSKRGTNISKYSSNDKLETNSQSSAQNNSVYNGSATGALAPLSPMNSKSSINIDEAFASTKSFTQRQKKLKGLLGIYVGNNDPRATWWGILPLFAKFPSPAMIASNHAADSPPSPGKDFHPPHASSLLMTKGEVDVEATNALLQISSLQNCGPVFVNDGAHQVPLFQGTPPLEMIASPDPFAWVVSRLNYQISKQIHKQSQFSQYISRILLSPLYCGMLLCRAGASTQYAIIHTASTDEKSDLGRGNQYRYSSTTLGSSSGKESSVHTNGSNNPSSHKFVGMNPNVNNSTVNSSKKDKKRKKKKYEDILLSTGCSAFIRVIDPRVKRLAGPPVSFLHNLSGNNNNANNNTPNTPYGNGNGGNVMLSVPGSPGPASALTPSPNQYPSGTNANGFVSMHSNHGVRSYQQDTLHDVLYLMSHFASESAEGTFSLQFDGKKYKQLRHDFSLQPHLYQQYNNARSKALASMLLRGGRGGQGRSFLNAIPDSIEKEALIQEINNKFYDVLSS